MALSPRFARTMTAGVPMAVAVLLSSLVFMALPALSRAHLSTEYLHLTTEYIRLT
jgi:hypothetical protein